MNTRRLTIAATAGAVSLLLLEPGVAQEKVRLNMGAATPSSVAIVGTGQLYFIDKVKKLSAGSIDPIVPYIHENAPVSRFDPHANSAAILIRECILRGIGYELMWSRRFTACPLHSREQANYTRK